MIKVTINDEDINLLDKWAGRIFDTAVAILIFFIGACVVYWGVIVTFTEIFFLGVVMVLIGLIILAGGMKWCTWWYKGFPE